MDDDTTTPTTVGTLAVPGATLHYEVCGSGPVLLLIGGGPTDADGFATVAAALADRYRVVTYDPRGLSRSRVDGPLDQLPVRVQADDASRLLAAVGDRPAYVFGHSSGAFTGLDLVAGHPGQVRALVAYEPPITELLEDRELHRAQGEEIYDLYRREGVWPAMTKFLADEGLDGGPDPAGPEPPGEPSPEMLEGMARMQPNLEFFLGYMWQGLAGYLPDLAALRAAPTRVVVAAGAGSAGQTAHRAAVALAERLATQVVVFPGEHSDFDADPGAFADRLHQVLQGA